MIDDKKLEMSTKIAVMEVRMAELKQERDNLEAELLDMEEKCQFWCDEARKLGYKE